MRWISPMLLAAAAIACAPARAPLEVDWTFGGQPCSAAGVATIQVDIQDEVLSPNQFTCAEASLGVDLGTYLIGNYQITVSGFDAAGGLAYQTTQTIQVRHGSNRLPIDVPAVPDASGGVTLHWTFASRTCAQAGVSVLHVSVDNQVITDDANNADLPCSSGGVDGTTIAPLTQGRHSFDLVGLVNGQPRFALNNFLATVTAGGNTPASADLAPAAPTTASASLTWAFDGKSCAAANVDHVQIFFDPNANGTGGTDAGTVACTSSGTDGASVDDVPEGTHSFAITGIRAGHIVYFTHHPPSTIFRVGLISDLFVPAESP